jgi:DNA-binding response OmpR family regulator
LETYRAERDGVELHLTKKELKILQLLLENKGKVISKEEIINKLWQGFYEENNNIVSVYINYLRNKVDKDFSEKLIENVRGIGYIIR